jgi:hypothetical protein
MAVLVTDPYSARPMSAQIVECKLNLSIIPERLPALSEKNFFSCHCGTATASVLLPYHIMEKCSTHELLSSLVPHDL